MWDAQPTILVVEDDDSLRLLCRVNLELEGFRVLEAATLARARELLASEEPSVILLDLHVSGEDGRMLLDEARQLDPPPAVLLFTGTVEIDDELRARTEGSVSKPFEIEDLVAAVRGAAGR